MALFHCEVDEDRITANVFNAPLPRWKENYSSIPLVAALGIHMLAISATSAQSDLLFSKVGQIVMDRRPSLGSDDV